MSTSLILSELFVHPLKSGAALSVPSAVVSDTGLQFDREWMVVDSSGEFLSQREHPRLALVRSELRHSELVLRAPGMIALHLRLDAAEGEMQVQVWNDTVPAFDMGALAAQWFSDYLGVRGLRLAAHDSAAERWADADHSGGAQARTAFSDASPLLVVSQASLDECRRRLQAAGVDGFDLRRLRPNWVLTGLSAPHEEDHLDTLEVRTAEGPVVLRLTRPCARCSMPDIHPDTAELDPRVGDVLRSYRSLPALQGAVGFGMHAVVVEGIGRTVRRGDTVHALSGAWSG